ncbi:MAG: hypothetical protein RIR70_791 [Pseudomonadota bacterium]|jgi:hypothetical protein
MPPRQLAKLPLFGPIAPWLERFDTLPSLPTLNQIARDLKLTNAAGQPIVFVPEGDAGVPYERQVFERGEIPTRPGSWHDVFNALCWFAYPRTKAALNARHIAHLQPGPRGAMRDAATQFDECGLIVLHTHPPLAQCLMAHEWHQAFWQQREALMHSMRFLWWAMRFLKSSTRRIMGSVPRRCICTWSALVTRPPSKHSSKKPTRESPRL